MKAMFILLSPEELTDEMRRRLRERLLAFARSHNDVLFDSVGDEFYLTASRLGFEGYEGLVQEVSDFSAGIGMYVEDVIEYLE